MSEGMPAVRPENDMATWEPGYLEDPYPFYAGRRSEAPACPVLTEGLPAWLLTRYDDARRLLADPSVKNDLVHAGPSARAVPWVQAGNPHVLVRNLLRLDPPEHTRLRRLVARAFTARRVAALRPRIQQVTDELTAGILPRGQADLIGDFSLPLTLTIISELLGVPEADREEFVYWTNIYVGVVEGDAQLRQQALAGIWDCLVTLIGRQGAAGADSDGSSLLGALIAARDEGSGLSADELVSLAFLLLVAGYETTSSLIGNGMLALLRNPGQLAVLRADLSLLPGAIEEFLRYDSPVKMAAVLRFTTRPVQAGGTVIPAGQTLLMCVGAANRDPERFPDPDALDIGRDASGHLAFGFGPHFCLGAPLARAEAEIAFTALLTRFPGLALGPGTHSWRQQRILRGLKSLSVTFAAAAPGSTP